jgi:two-component system, chemotaxis family, CheB/CheR fusion protein
MAEQERNWTENPPAGIEEEPDDVKTREAPSPAADDPEWAGLLHYLLETRGFDFHGYKPASLARRIRKRMESVGVDQFAAYRDFLELHAGEFATLFNTILINVTGFFRDPGAWEVVRERAIPQILAGKSARDPIRAWSAGCATGEEAYTIAMLLAEAMGMDAFQERVKIYATDLDEDALNTARHAAYPEHSIEGVPAGLREKYFEHLDDSYFFRKDLRRSVIFGRHDLISDAPISRVDLVTCRNTLMYLNSDTQTQVLARLHFALNDGGFLLLGRAETLMSYNHTFVPVDLKRRLSRKNSPSRRRRERDPGREESLVQPVSGDHDLRMRIAAMELSPVAQIVVDAAGVVTVANERARTLFGLRLSDVGRPLRDLQISYRPIELRSLIERAETDRRAVVVKEIDWPSHSSDGCCLDLHVAPLTDTAGGITGTVLTFSDVTTYRRLQQELKESHQDLETAHEELQSTNEELETMNEELQSTNEELQTMNDELRTRGQELNASNAFLASVLGSLHGRWRSGGKS